MIRSHSLRPGRPATSLESQSHLNIILHQECGKTRQTKLAVFIVHNRDSSPNSTAGRIRPGYHAHVFVSMECPGLPESLGPAHEAMSMAPKSLAQHHLRFISWSRGGDRRGVSIEGCPRDSAWRKLMAVSWCFREAGDRGLTTRGSQLGEYIGTLSAPILSARPGCWRSCSPYSRPSSSQHAGGGAARP